MPSTRRQFLKDALAATAFLATGGWPEARRPRQVEARQIFEANSWQELRDQIWRNSPDLLSEVSRLIENQGAQFNNPEFVKKFQEERRLNNRDLVHGIIVVRRSAFLNGLGPTINRLYPSVAPSLAGQSLAELEDLTFTEPFSAALRNSANQGFDLPNNLVADIAVVPDEILGPDTQVFFADPNGGSTPIPSNFFADGNVLPWPPNIDWIIFDADPLTVNTVLDNQPDRSRLISTGWIHEQTHLLGTMDLYRYLLEDNAWTVMPAGEIGAVTDLIRGWSEHNLTKASLAPDDIMFSVSLPFAKITALSALQIAVARRQQIYSTMYEGLPDFLGLWPMDYAIEILDPQGKNITPPRITRFGNVVRNDDREKFGDQAFGDRQDPKFWTRTIEPRGKYFEISDLYFLGVDLDFGGKIFTLPMTVIFNLLNRLRQPLPSDQDTAKLSLSIRAENIPANLEWFKSHGHDNNQPLKIDLAMLTQTEWEELRAHQGGKNGVVLAHALLEVAEELFQSGRKQEIYLVWLARIDD